MESKRLIFQVAVGEVPDFYATCIASVARYADRIGADHVVLREPVLRISPVKSARSVNALRLGYLPIYEKEAAFGYFDRYERIAILDADVYVMDTAPDVFMESDADFAGVVERDMPLTSQYADKVRKYSEGQYRLLDDVDWAWNAKGADFYNMGVMVLNRTIVPHIGGTPEQFLRRPEFERFINGEGHWKWSTDQTLLNYWVKKSGMTADKLDWKWNALFGAVENISGAHFVHFFLSSKTPGVSGALKSLEASRRNRA